MRTVLLVAAASLFAGCVSDPEAPQAQRTTSEVLVAEVHADAFVTAAGRRLPREAFVLELRLRTRAMSDEQRLSLRVELDADDDESEASLRHAEWILDQLQIMGVGYAALR